MLTIVHVIHIFSFLKLQFMNISFLVNKAEVILRHFVCKITCAYQKINMIRLQAFLFRSEFGKDIYYTFIYFEPY